MINRAAIASLCLAAAGFVACGDNGGDAAAPESYEIDESYTRGPVRFRVALDRREITIADRLTMLLETRARDGYIVELPRFGEKLHEFGIVDYETPPPELESDGTVVTRRIYRLEPFLSGEYRIPPMTVSFREEGDTLFHALESDTIRVRVGSILPDDQAGLEIRDITGPVDYPASYKKALIIAAACIAAAAAAVFIVMRLRKRREREAPPPMAHEVAFERLELLLARGWIEDKRYREFIEEISDILRHYIEDRFGLHAPERTTEEFLAEAESGPGIPADRRDMIGTFLMYCDLVKFAAYEPSADDVKRTFETCRDFIDATKVEGVRNAAA